MLTLTYPVPNRQWLPTDRDRIGRSSNGIWTPTTLKAQTPSDSMIRLPLDQWVPGRRIRFAVCSTNCGNFVRQREGLSGVFQWLPVVRGGICAPGVLASTGARPHCTVVCQYHSAGNTGASHHGHQGLGCAVCSSSREMDSILKAFDVAMAFNWKSQQMKHSSAFMSSTQNWMRKHIALLHSSLSS